MSPDLTDSQALILFAVGAVFAFAATSLMVFGLFRSARLDPADKMLVSTLGILSMFALTGAIITRDDGLTALAGTGIGAVAGAVAARWHDRDE